MHRYLDQALAQHFSAMRHINQENRSLELNHDNYVQWPHSSYKDYVNGRCRSWIDSLPTLELFTDTDQYVEFVSDYEDLHRERDVIKRDGNRDQRHQICRLRDIDSVRSYVPDADDYDRYHHKQTSQGSALI